MGGRATPSPPRALCHVTRTGLGPRVCHHLRHRRRCLREVEQWACGPGALSRGRGEAALGGSEGREIPGGREERALGGREEPARLGRAELLPCWPALNQAPAFQRSAVPPPGCPLDNGVLSRPPPCEPSGGVLWPPPPSSVLVLVALQRWVWGGLGRHPVCHCHLSGTEDCSLLSA